MSYNFGPQIITNGLILCLDAANSKSYPGNGTTWYDLSSCANNASICALSGGINFNSTVNKGILSISGITASLDNYFGITNTISFIDQEPRTLEFIFNLTGYSGNTFHGFCGVGSTNPWCSFRYVNGTSFYILYRDSAATYWNSSTMTKSVCGWHTFSYTFDADRTLKFYCDGQYISSAACTSTTQNITRFAAGYDNGANRFCWNGYAGMIRIYRTILTDAEILQNYNVMRYRFI
jgi:hypothetical protein